MSVSEGRGAAWWICSGGFLNNGGKRFLGPFVSEQLALKVREYVEKAEGHESLYIDETREGIR